MPLISGTLSLLTLFKTIIVLVPQWWLLNTFIWRKNVQNIWTIFDNFTVPYGGLWEFTLSWRVLYAYSIPKPQNHCTVATQPCFSFMVSSSFIVYWETQILFCSYCPTLKNALMVSNWSRIHKYSTKSYYNCTG